jgi:hypothetical protein
MPLIDRLIETTRVDRERWQRYLVATAAAVAALAVVHTAPAVLAPTLAFVLYLAAVLAAGGFVAGHVRKRRDIGQSVLDMQVRAADAARMSLDQDFIRLDPGRRKFGDAKRHAEGREIVGQDVCRKAGMLLIQIERDDIELDRCMRTQTQQNIEQCVAVFAAGEAQDVADGFCHV